MRQERARGSFLTFVFFALCFVTVPSTSIRCTSCLKRFNVKGGRRGPVPTPTVGTSVSTSFFQDLRQYVSPICCPTAKCNLTRSAKPLNKNNTGIWRSCLRDGMFAFGGTGLAAAAYLPAAAVLVEPATSCSHRVRESVIGQTQLDAWGKRPRERPQERARRSSRFNLFACLMHRPCGG